MKKFLTIVLICVLVFFAGWLLLSDFGLIHQQEQAGTYSHDSHYLLDGPFGGPWPPPDEG